MQHGGDSAPVHKRGPQLARAGPLVIAAYAIADGLASTTKMMFTSIRMAEEFGRRGTQDAAVANPRTR